MEKHHLRNSGTYACFHECAQQAGRGRSESAGGDSSGWGGEAGPPRPPRPPPASGLAGCLPDQDALVVVALPQAAVALVGHGEDVGGQLPQVALAVALHGRALVQAGDGLVGVHRGDDGADVGLQAQGHRHTGHWARAAHLRPPGLGRDGGSPCGSVPLPVKGRSGHLSLNMSFNRVHLVSGRGTATSDPRCICFSCNILVQNLIILYK